MIGIKGKFYVTTPIYYINYTPSVGSAYPTIAADVLARWHRALGENVFFLTGLDENSAKTVQAAKEAGYKDIKKYTDDMAVKWIGVWKKLDISNDDFIRTTEERHKKVVQDFFMKINANGDIYKGKYEGLYCDGCEAFYTEKDLVDGKCPYHQKKPKVISEENYFFRLSKYQQKLLEHIKKNPDFIKPESKRNEVVSFLKEGLQDISISRLGLSWGIPLPIDEKHVFWCWLDALTNYISGAHGNWPATLHIVGKDISKFHCLFWPAFLMSAGYELPKAIFVHGFFTVNGKKMSKSLGNVIDPLYLAEKYGVDALRYYLMREFPFGEDGDFSEEALKNRLNNELANELGNLLQRTLVLIEKNCGSKIPEGETDKILQNKLNLNKIRNHMEKLELHFTLGEIFSFIAHCNAYVNEKAPWKLKGEELNNVLYSLADSLRITAILLAPFIPGTSEKISSQLGARLGNIDECRFGLLKSGEKIKKGEVLFKKIK